MMRPPEQAALPQRVGHPEAGNLLALSLAGRPPSIQIAITSCFNPSLCALSWCWVCKIESTRCPMPSGSMWSV